jgi:hypothetical protein
MVCMHGETEQSESGAMGDGYQNGSDVGMPPATRESLSRWLRMQAEGSLQDLPAIVAIDAVFHSPVGLNPYHGRELLCLVLSTAATIFEDFRYHRCYYAASGAVLEFSARIGAQPLKGIHMIAFDAAGKIVEVEKMIRPSAAAVMLGDAIGEKCGPQIRALRGNAAVSR